MLNLLIVGVLAGCVAQPSGKGDAAAPPAPPVAASAAPLDWKKLEAPLLTEHAQLTRREQFVKAGEAYFDHNSPPEWVIFQAVPVPPKGKEANAFYTMYVARLKYDQGQIAGIEEPVIVSTEASANTCGWFEPEKTGAVLFATTEVAPEQKETPGYQRGSGKYRWEFPSNMRIVTERVPQLDNPTLPPTHRMTRTKFKIAGDGYQAECSCSKDGRFVLYAKMIDPATKDLDIYVFDNRTAKEYCLVKAPGYDGGPFFSPDGKRICYRSDRAGNDLLQVYVADLKFEDGVPVGIEREHQVTANEHVNWAPFWHPSGKFLVYGTSEMGHSNYEVFAVEVPEATDDTKPSKLLRRRITHANGADVLPVFSDDGQWMMWTAQRGPMVEGESKPSSQVWVARATPVFRSSNSMREQILSLSRADAEKRMRALLTEFAAQESHRIRQNGGSPGNPNLENLEIERTAHGWRTTVNLWNVPDNQRTAFMLNDGRWVVFPNNTAPIVPSDIGFDADLLKLMGEPPVPEP